MLRKLRPRSIYDVMAAIACFGVLAGGTAYAANEWTGANIVDGSLTGADVFDNTISGNDITNGSVSGTDIKDGSLTAKDVGVSQLSNVPVDVGQVSAHRCSYAALAGLSTDSDHILVTPNYSDSIEDFSYGVEYTNSTPHLKICNLTDNPIDGGTEHFNFLVIKH